MLTPTRLRHAVSLSLLPARPTASQSLPARLDLQRHTSFPFWHHRSFAKDKNFGSLSVQGCFKGTCFRRLDLIWLNFCNRSWLAPKYYKMKFCVISNFHLLSVYEEKSMCLGFTNPKNIVYLFSYKHLRHKSSYVTNFTVIRWLIL